MWKTLVTVIQNVNKDAELADFLSAVKAAGICVKELAPEELCELPGDENPRQLFQVQKKRKEMLVLTDLPEIADRTMRAGIALLGLEWKGGAPITAAPYVTLGLDGIDTEYLHMVYKRFHGEPLVIAETERLCIRELVCSEAADFIRLGQEAGCRITDITGTEEGWDPEKFMKAYIRGQYALYGYGFWAVTDRTSGELLGIAGVEDREWAGEYYLELGYAVKKRWRGRGIAAEAGKAIIRFLREEPGIMGKIKCFVPKENIASQKTAQSIGMLQTEEIFNECYCYERIL